MIFSLVGGVSREPIPCLDMNGQLSTTIAAENAEENSNPADKVQSGISLDIGPVNISTSPIFDISPPDSFQRAWWLLLDQCCPGFKQRIMRPPRA